MGIVKRCKNGWTGRSQCMEEKQWPQLKLQGCTRPFHARTEQTLCVFLMAHCSSCILRACSSAFRSSRLACSSSYRWQRMVSAWAVFIARAHYPLQGDIHIPHLKPFLKKYKEKKEGRGGGRWGGGGDGNVNRASGSPCRPARASWSPRCCRRPERRQTLVRGA